MIYEVAVSLGILSGIQSNCSKEKEKQKTRHYFVIGG